MVTITLKLSDREISTTADTAAEAIDAMDRLQRMPTGDPVEWRARLQVQAGSISSVPASKFAVNVEGTMIVIRAGELADYRFNVLSDDVPEVAKHIAQYFATVERDAYDRIRNSVQ